MKYHLTFLFTAALFAACTSNVAKEESGPAAKLTFASPEEVGVSSDSLALIDEMVMTYVDRKRFPGAVVLIAKDGRIIYETEIGWSDSLQVKPYQKDHIFRMASMTKPFTSLATLQLMEAGKLHLDDPVSRYIPEFANPRILTSFHQEDSTWESRPAKKEPTIHHLLTHTAGIPYGFMNPPLFGAILMKNEVPDLATHLDFTLQEKMSVLATLPLAHEPGEQWMYGLNTDVLGRVVEVCSGMSLSDYFEQNIMKPLGIRDMDFFLDEEQSVRLVDVYVANQDSMISYMRNAGPMYDGNYPKSGAKSYYSGGSGLSGTARDYYVFCQALLNNGVFGETQLLRPETVQLMRTSQIDTISYPWGPYKFGYGFDVADGHPLRPDGTFSWGGAFSTVFWIDPENELIAIMLSQVLFAPDNSMAREFERIVYSALPGKSSF